jgi:hypothetical protein
MGNGPFPGGRGQRPGLGVRAEAAEQPGAVRLREAPPQKGDSPGHASHKDRGLAARQAHGVHNHAARSGQGAGTLHERRQFNLPGRRHRRNPGLPPHRHAADGLPRHRRRLPQERDGSLPVRKRTARRPDDPDIHRLLPPHGGKGAREGGNDDRADSRLHRVRRKRFGDPRGANGGRVLRGGTVPAQAGFAERAGRGGNRGVHMEADGRLFGELPALVPLGAGHPAVRVQDRVGPVTRASASRCADRAAVLEETGPVPSGLRPQVHGWCFRTSISSRRSRCWRTSS